MWCFYSVIQFACSITFTADLQPQTAPYFSVHHPIRSCHVQSWNPVRTLRTPHEMVQFEGLWMEFISFISFDHLLDVIRLGELSWLLEGSCFLRCDSYLHAFHVYEHMPVISMNRAFIPFLKYEHINTISHTKYHILDNNRHFFCSISPTSS